MARINTNIASVIAQSNLSQTQNELQMRFERLSTGLKINRGKDDPAGLIISERLRSDIKGVQTGMDNASRASSVLSTTEASLGEVSDLLNSIKSLIVQSANSGANSDAERQANQLQIDSAIDSITRISDTASFGGLKLLNGQLGYTLSGVKNSSIGKTQVFNATLLNTNSLQVNVQQLSAAQLGGVYYQGPTGKENQIVSSMTLEVRGNRGVQTLTFVSGTKLSAVVAAVNSVKGLTGVTASLISTNTMTSGMVFRSEGYGSDSFVSVKRLGAPATGDTFVTKSFANNYVPPSTVPFPWNNPNLQTASQDSGKDVIALVNGDLATGKGTSLSVNSPSLSMNLDLTTAFATVAGQPTTTFNITGGGALFQLGPQVNALQQVNVGVQSVAASQLGGTANITAGGRLEFLSSLKTGQGNSISQSVAKRDFTMASDILDKAIDEISSLRGRLGAFEKNVLQTNVRSLQSAYENLTASDSQIRDADFAQETSSMTRAQILQSSGTSVLSLANQSSQSVLRLLQ